MKIIGKILYYSFNIIIGTLIGILTWIPRLILNKMGYKTNIYNWLDRKFPLPNDEIFKKEYNKIPNLIFKSVNKMSLYLLFFLMVSTSCNYTKVQNTLYNSGYLKFEIIYCVNSDKDILKSYVKNKNVHNISGYNNKLHFTYKTVINFKKIGYDKLQYNNKFERLFITMHVVVHDNLFRTVLKLSKLIIVEYDKVVPINKLDKPDKKALDQLIKDLALLELQIN